MKILFVTGLPVAPQIVGGAQTDATAIICGLMARGHDVRMLAALMPGGTFGNIARVRAKLSRNGWATDRVLGHMTYRAWDVAAALPNLVDHWQPDVAVVLAKKPALIAGILQSKGSKYVVAFQDNELAYLGGNFDQSGKFPAIANSGYTSRKYFDAFGIDSTVIFPVFNQQTYLVKRHGTAVTFINPHPLKGLTKFIEIASLMPEQEFLAVEGWTMNPDDLLSFKEAIAGLPNVRFMKSTNNMRDVYAQTKLLLVPSQWEEGYGRVATEAQISGIPVVSSDRGGLPEAVGTGGVVVPAEAPAHQWVSEIRSVLDDPDKYRSLSEAAVEWANRPELNFESQLDKWEMQIVRASS